MSTIKRMYSGENNHLSASQCLPLHQQGQATGVLPLTVNVKYCSYRSRNGAWQFESTNRRSPHSQWWQQRDFVLLEPFSFPFFPKTKLPVSALHALWHAVTVSKEVKCRWTLQKRGRLRKLSTKMSWHCFVSCQSITGSTVMHSPCQNSDLLTHPIARVFSPFFFFCW